MITLRVDLEVRDYDMWRQAFEKDAGGREQHGARGYRIFRSVGSGNELSLDLDFGSKEEAEGFVRVLQEEVWASKEKAPAKLGAPQTRIVEGSLPPRRMPKGS